jgi:bifunctional non-homologous end joining protein LigD
MFLSLAFS